MRPRWLKPALSGRPAVEAGRSAEIAGRVRRARRNWADAMARSRTGGAVVGSRRRDIRAASGGVNAIRCPASAGRGAGGSSQDPARLADAGGGRHHPLRSLRAQGPRGTASGAGMDIGSHFRVPPSAQAVEPPGLLWASGQARTLGRRNDVGPSPGIRTLQALTVIL